MIQKAIRLSLFLNFILFELLSISAAAQGVIETKVHEPTTLVYPPVQHAPLHKATAVHLFAFMALIGRTDVTPNDPQGVAAIRLQSTDDPQNKNDDDDLTVYGVNSGQNNIIFNSSMQSIDIYEGKGPKQKLKKPRGIACNEQGDVYVADTGNNRIVHLFNPGSYLSFVDAFGKKGSKPGEFAEPHGIALGTDGRIYVTDTANDRIQVFDKSTKFLYAIGDKNDSSGLSVSMSRPEAIAFTDAENPNTYFKDNFLIVTDLNNTRIRKLTPEGRFIAAVNSTDYGYQQVYLTSAAIDYYSNVWVTDMFNHCVHKFDRDLNYITSYGRIGDGDGQFFEPRGIAIGKKFGQVFIADKNSAQYLHIGTDILNFNISWQDSSIRFDFSLTEYSRVTAKILDEKNRPVAVLCNNRLLPLGANSFFWDRKANAGLMNLVFPTELLKQKLALDSTANGQRRMTDSIQTASSTPEALKSGLYKIRIEARTGYLYSRYFTKKIEVEFAI